MKSRIIVFLFFALFAINFSNAHPANEYFVGKWQILVKDTPVGDDTFVVRIAFADGKYEGFVLDPDTHSEKKMNSISIEGEKLSADFEWTTYQLKMVLTKVNENIAKAQINETYAADAARQI